MLTYHRLFSSVIAVFTCFGTLPSQYASAEVCPEGSGGHTFKLMRNTSNLHLEILPAPPELGLTGDILPLPVRDSRGERHLARIDAAGTLSFRKISTGVGPELLPLLVPDCTFGGCRLKAAATRGDAVLVVSRPGRSRLTVIHPERIGADRFAVLDLGGELRGVTVDPSQNMLGYILADGPHIRIRWPGSTRNDDITSTLSAFEQSRFHSVWEFLGLPDGRILMHLGLGFGFTLRKHVDRISRSLDINFLPLDWRWFANIAVGDINGDGYQDVITYAPPSRTLWSAVGEGEGYFEQPIDTSVPPEATWLLRASTDVSGDGSDDLLIFDSHAAKWLLGVSRATEPIANEEISLQEGVRSTSAVGELCAKPEQFRMQSSIEIRGQTYDVVYRAELSRQQTQILLRQRASTGAKFSLHESLHGPYACIGYNPEGDSTGRFEANLKWGCQPRSCAPGYAAYGSQEVHAGESMLQADVGPACCPLPADDILVGEAEEFSSSCPDGWVYVGSRPADSLGKTAWWCRKVGDRYLLGEEFGGRYFGLGFSIHQHRNRIRADQIPEPIRYGILREGSASFVNDGCIGDPFGSLLTGRIEHEQGCSRLRFRRLLYKGLPGDPPAGTPVVMFPTDCSYIDDPTTPTAGCRRSTQAD